jgi:hypothetical protein
MWNTFSKKVPTFIPTSAIYNASAVKIYNAMSSLVRLENKSIVL